MIPLSNWLSAGERGGSRAALAEISASCSCSADQEQSRAAGIEDALRRGRLEGAEATAQEWEGRLAAIKAAHAAAFDALRAEADRRLAIAIADSISESVAALRMDIERAVGSALRPFLAEQANQAAVAELLRLIGEDLKQQSSPHLEIRAPEPLHEALRSLLAERSIACVLTEADDIRLISAEGSLRYESLAASWIAALEGYAA